MILNQPNHIRATFTLPVVSSSRRFSCRALVATQKPQIATRQRCDAMSSCRPKIFLAHIFFCVWSIKLVDFFDVFPCSIHLLSTSNNVSIGFTPQTTSKIISLSKDSLFVVNLGYLGWLGLYLTSRREKIREEKVSEERRCRCSKTQANKLRQEMKDCPMRTWETKWPIEPQVQNGSERPREPLSMNTDRSDQPNKNDLTSKPWTSKNNSISYQIVSEIIFRSFKLVCFESLVCFSVPGKGHREETSREKIREEKASEERRCRCSKTQANILRQEMKDCPMRTWETKWPIEPQVQNGPESHFAMMAQRATEHEHWQIRPAKQKRPYK